MRPSAYLFIAIVLTTEAIHCQQTTIDQFYHSISPEQRDLAKWLVSDAIQMQGLAWYIFDSLSFNKPFLPSFLKNYDIKFNDWVTFTSRYQKLTWTGITKYNNQVCAIIKFESLYNPLKVDNSQICTHRPRNLLDDSQSWGLHLLPHRRI